LCLVSALCPAFFEAVPVANATQPGVWPTWNKDFMPGCGLDAGIAENVNAQAPVKIRSRPGGPASSTKTC
jgi:hypothetical protein